MSEIKRDLILGVDPGFSGALALLNTRTRKIVACIDMPVFNIRSKNHIDQFPLSLWIKQWEPRIDFAVCEKVAAMTRQGVSSMFRFGENYGIVQGIISAHLIRTTLVVPAVWKCDLGLSHKKVESLELARHLFTDSYKLFTRMGDDGRAEACLLAHYGRKKLGVENLF